MGRLKNSSLGHERQMEMLRRAAPDVMHFIGPDGVGKRKFAREWHFKVNGTHSEPDFAYIKNPRVAEVEAYCDFARLPGLGAHRTIVVELTRPWNHAAIDRLLPLLDDPKYAKVIIISTEDLPEVLATRVARYPFHPLSDEQIQVLLEERGLTADFASRVAPQAEGIPARALEFRNQEKPKMLIMKFVSGIAERDRRAIGTSFSNWDNKTHTRLLRSWLQESLTGNWNQYKPEDDRPIPRENKMALLAATSRHYKVARLKRAAEDITRGGSGV